MIDQILKLRDAGHPIKKICEALGISRNTVRKQKIALDGASITVTFQGMSLAEISKISYLYKTMYPRRDILENNSYTHVFFRCHSRNFFFKNKHVKGYLLYLWAKYKSKYRIKIYEFNIMDNHAHALMKAPSPEHLGHFMRTVNSLLARYINQVFERDSQAIRERYRSPMVGTGGYYRQLVQYIWTNRFKVDGRNPLTDPYCSASWRFDPRIISVVSDNDEEASLFASLLDDHEYLLEPGKSSISKMVKELLNEAIQKIVGLVDSVFMHSHTISSKDSIEFRAGLLKAFRRDRVPWKDPLDKPYFQTI